MRKSVFLISALFAISLGAYAQNDDMYFTPTKTPKVKKEQLLKVQEGIYEKSDDDVYSAEDYNNKNYSEAEVDAYNRRGYKVGKDTLYIGDGDMAFPIIGDGVTVGMIGGGTDLVFRLVPGVAQVGTAEDT